MNLIRVKPDQGHAIRRVLGEGSNSTKSRIACKLFLEGLKFIINGVIDRKFIFKMPFKNLDVKLKIILASKERSMPLIRYCRGRIDPFELGFQVFNIVLEITFPKRPKIHLSVHVSKEMYDVMLEAKRQNLTYENSKIATLDNVVEHLVKMYPDVQESSISSSVRHGLNMMFKGLVHRCDTYINLDHGDDKFFVYFSGGKRISQYIRVRKKIRFLMKNKKGKPKHDGSFYYSLTDDNKELFDRGEEVKVYCTRYIEELFICKQYARNIYKIEMKESLRYSFFKDINKQNDSTEYIYRWINNGFESIDNTKDSSDRCS